MSIIRILFAVLPLFFSSIGFALGAPPCLSFSECNDEGGKAYRKKDYLAAIALYEWQLRYAEMQKGEASQDEELALNNLLVTNLKNENLAKARAWMWVALDRGFGGKATRFNVERTIQAFDYRGMPGMQGHYERYAGMGEWETLDIEPNEQGVEMAIFSLMRIGNPNTLAQSGPAAIGDLGVRLAGTKDYRTAIPEDLDVGCSLQILKEGFDITVVEDFKEGCQDYGGMGIHAAGTWRKIGQIVMNKTSESCVRVRDGADGSGPTGGSVCMKFSYEQRRAVQVLSLGLGESYADTVEKLSKNGWEFDEKWLSEESTEEGGTHKLPVCGQGWDAICQVVMDKGSSRLQLTFSGTNDGLPLIDINQLASGEM